MKKKVRSKNLEVARFMPPLRHTVTDQSFNIKKSEVVMWLIEQPEILNYVWNNIKNSGDVAYDPESKRWHGVEYED